jgi:hypothetical protein
MDNELVEELWSSLIDIEDYSMHKGRIEMLNIMIFFK